MWLMEILGLKFIFAPLIFLVMKKIIEINRDENYYPLGEPQTMTLFWQGVLISLIFLFALLSVMIIKNESFSLLECTLAVLSVLLAYLVSSYAIMISMRIRTGYYEQSFKKKPIFVKIMMKFLKPRKEEKSQKQPIFIRIMRKFIKLKNKESYEVKNFEERFD